MHAEVGELWSSLSGEEKATYDEMAAREQTQRDQYQKAPFGQDVEPPDLTLAQKQRLYGEKLDRSLSTVANHPVWESGLRISDHVSALRGSLCQCDVNREELNKEFRHVFGHDPQAVPNPERLPEILRPCHQPCGGVCQNDPLFSHVSSLVQQFHAGMSKFLDKPVLVCVSCSAAEGSSAWPHRCPWFIVGCASLRPIVHMLFVLCQPRAQVLAFEQAEGRPVPKTFHQVCKELVSEHVKVRRLGLEAFSATVSVFASQNVFTSDAGVFLTIPLASEIKHEFSIGAGAGRAQRAHSDTAGVDLPFASLFVKRKQKVKGPVHPQKPKQPRQQAQGDASNLSESEAEAAGVDIVGQGAGKRNPVEKSDSQGSDHDHAPIILSEACGAELAAAQGAETSMLENPVPSVAPTPVVSMEPSNEIAKLPPPPKKVSTFFNAILGVQGLDVAKRKGMVCYLCEKELERGEMRFQFAPWLESSFAMP